MLLFFTLNAVKATSTKIKAESRAEQILHGALNRYSGVEIGVKSLIKSNCNTVQIGTFDTTYFTTKSEKSGERDFY